MRRGDWHLRAIVVNQHFADQSSHKSRISTSTNTLPTQSNENKTLTMVVFPSQVIPALSLPSVNGDLFSLKNSNPDLFTIVVFYRGAHCPICKTHIHEIEENKEKLRAAGLKIVAVSMDTKERAETFAKEVAASMGKDSLETPILYGLTEEQARNDWGLYISEARPGTNEPAIYSEPGLFVIRPDDTVFMAQVQSAPFTRPSVDQLIGGLLYAAEHKYPTRGTYVTKKPSHDAATPAPASAKTQ